MHRVGSQCWVPLFFLVAAVLFASAGVAEEPPASQPVLPDLGESVVPPIGAKSVGQAGRTAVLEFTLLKPRFQSNPAFAVVESDGIAFDSIVEQSFDYDLSLSPRVSLQHDCGIHGLGLRASYWEFDQSSATASASPPANGFGRIEHPQFGMIDLSTTIPTDTFTASSGVRAYVLDIETLVSRQLACWNLQLGTGIRYAYIQQDYLAELRTGGNTLQSAIDFRHSKQGIGPTLFLSVERPFTPGLALFGMARGALLFDNGSSRLSAAEDLDLANPFRTSRLTSSEDLLPQGELQLGLRWRRPDRCVGVWKPFVHVALEGQAWNGAGNASTQLGDLGFFGFNVAIGGSF